MELTEHTFAELTRIIHRLTGLVVGKDKSYLIKHRLSDVAKYFGCDTFEAMIHQLKATATGKLHDALIEAITTKETSFFRDAWLFEAISEFILPQCAATLTNSGGSRHRIRIWSAAASTGQEAHSLAMIVREMQNTSAASLPEKQVVILASDISTGALGHAKDGKYTNHEIRRGISDGRLRQHFRRAGDDWQIDETLAAMLRFRRIDLLHLPADLGPFDLVLCRNVLIYFDDHARKKICGHLFNLIEPGGWLALGAAESLYGLEERFETVKHGRAVFYRKPSKR